MGDFWSLCGGDQRRVCGQLGIEKFGGDSTQYWNGARNGADIDADVESLYANYDGFAALKSGGKIASWWGWSGGLWFYETDDGYPQQVRGVKGIYPIAEGVSAFLALLGPE